MQCLEYLLLLSLTHFLAKTIFSRGYGGVYKTWKKWKFRGGGEDLYEIPSMVEVWIFSGTTH